MIEIKIPGYKTLQLKHLVLDHNGTLAVDGILVAGVKESLDRLSADMEIHVLTADTFGKMTRTPANWRTLKSWAVSIQSASETGAMID
jgi:soluble P-type ATPase